ncbi:cyclase family protein [Streptomyces sp. NPDC088350]|uniref:cyclase family protein n=1 Tax=Streptomyces sp. NPDC088350 TaxID=3365854 RepID=UPI003806E595
MGHPCRPTRALRGRRAHPGPGSWERRNGRVPAGSFVALRTGWSRRRPDPVATANRDEAGISRTPGWSPDVLRQRCSPCTRCPETAMCA